MLVNFTTYAYCFAWLFLIVIRHIPYMPAQDRHQINNWSSWDQSISTIHISVLRCGRKYALVFVWLVWMERSRCNRRSITIPLQFETSTALVPQPYHIFVRWLFSFVPSPLPRYTFKLCKQSRSFVYAMLPVCKLPLFRVILWIQWARKYDIWLVQERNKTGRASKRMLLHVKALYTDGPWRRKWNKKNIK